MSLVSGRSTVFGNDGAQKRNVITCVGKSCRVALLSTQQAASSSIISGPIISCQKTFQQISPTPYFPAVNCFRSQESNYGLGTFSVSFLVFSNQGSCSFEWSFNWERWVRNNLRLIRKHGTYGLLEHRNRGVVVYTAISPYSSDSEGGSVRPPIIISF